MYDFVNSDRAYTEKEIDEYVETAEDICKARNILTPDNVLALLEAGHDNSEIANFYNIPITIVEHVVNHI